MEQTENNRIYFRGKFTGLFSRGKVRSNGEYTFTEFIWRYLMISDVRQAEVTAYADLKTDDYWYAPVLRNRTRFSFRSAAEIIIVGHENTAYSGALYHVVIKNISLRNRELTSSHDMSEATGDIYFYLEQAPPKQKKQPDKASGLNKSTLTGIDSITLVTDINSTTSGSHSGVSAPISSGSTGTSAPPLLHTDSTGSGKWSNYTANALSGLGLLFLLAYSALKSKLFFYLVLGFTILWLVRKFVKAGRIRNWLSLLLTLLLFAYMGGLFTNSQNEQELVQTEDGNLKISPPREDDPKPGSRDKDYLNDKEVEWHDFIKNHYFLKYTTSSLNYFESKQKHEQIATRISANAAIPYFHELYGNLMQLDEVKIQHVVDSLSAEANARKLNKFQLAEMVITFIQEIPYYLVHEGTCEQAASSDYYGFVGQYHRQRKPCLSNISGGVQSPYEFLHNLKGDCDTRSLLAFSMLKKMGISSSVWVSEVYGHSILGVGLPVGYGIHKPVQGVRHFGVELTAKGYRLGMVSPDNSKPDNWDIAIHYNVN